LPWGSHSSLNSMLVDPFSISALFTTSNACSKIVTRRHQPTSSFKHGYNSMWSFTSWRENTFGGGFELDFMHYLTRITSTVKAKIPYRFHLLDCGERTCDWKGTIILKFCT